MNFKEFLLEATTELSSWMRFIKKGINSPNNYLVLSDKIEEIGAPLLAQCIREAANALRRAYSREEYQSVNPNYLIARELAKFGVYHIFIPSDLNYYIAPEVYLTKPIIKNQTYYDYTNDDFAEILEPEKISNIAEPEEGAEPQPDYIVKDKRLYYPVWIYPNGMVLAYYGLGRSWAIKGRNSYRGDASKELSIIDVNNLGLQLAYLYIMAYKIRANPNQFLDTNKVTTNPMSINNLLLMLDIPVFNNTITIYFMQNFLKSFSDHVRSGGITSIDNLARIANRLLELEVRGSAAFHDAAIAFANNIPGMKTSNKILYHIGKLYRSL